MNVSRWTEKNALSEESTKDGTAYQLPVLQDDEIVEAQTPKLNKRQEVESFIEAAEILYNNDYIFTRTRIYNDNVVNFEIFK